jgi:hypothetical protein
MVIGVWRHFLQYFSYIVKWWRKPEFLMEELKNGHKAQKETVSI